MIRFCVIAFQILLFAALPAEAQKIKPPQGEPVIINRDTLFKFYTGQGLLTAKERAEVINSRLAGITNRIAFNPDSLKLKNDTSLSVIYYESQIVLALSDKDASFSELNRPQLAANYLNILKQNLGNFFSNNSIKAWAINIGEAVAVIVLLILLIWALNRAFRWVKLKTLKAWDSRLAKLAKKGAPVGYAARLRPFIVNIVRVVRIAIIILLVYLSLPILFFIFPASKSISTELLSYIVNPLRDIALSLLHFIPNLLTIAVIYIVTRYIVKLVKFIAAEIENGSFTIKNFYPEWAVPTYNIIRVVLYAFMFVVIFPYLPGSESKVFQGVTVFIGVLFSFGSSSAISNMVAGIVLTYMRAFKVGDRIQAGDVVGDVFEKNLLVTRIRTIKNEDITIPNSTILGSHTLNYTSSCKTLGLILHTSVTIGYDAPWKTVHELMINAALATEGIQKKPTPFVLQTDLNDFNVTYQVNAYTDQPNKMAVIYSALHQQIQDKFNEAGVEIMSPHFTSLRDGNRIQIPDDYIGKDYKSPGFNFSKEK